MSCEAVATMETDVEEKAASLRAWVKGQEEALADTTGPLKPGQEWLAGFHRSWVRLENGSAPHGFDLHETVIQTVCDAPEGTPEPILRGAIFANLLKRTAPVVKDGFELAGHWVHDGRFVWTPLEQRPMPEEERSRILRAHPVRHFGTCWDHAVPETMEYLRDGIGATLRRIDAELGKTCTDEERAFLTGMKMAVEAFSNYIARHADEAARQGLHERAESLRHIALGAPRSFYEALQLIWFRYVVMTREGRSAMAFGRFDQHLVRFYRADLAAGRITRGHAVGLVCEMLAGVYWTNTADFTIGGLLPDGRDGANEVSLILLDAARLMRIPNASLFARVHKNSAPEYLDACANLIFSGGGMPAIMIDELALEQLKAIGITGDDAINHCFTGCAHLFVEGLQVPWREEWVVMPESLVGVLKGLTGREGLTFETVMETYRERLRAIVREDRERRNEIFAGSNPANSCDVFYSAFTDDCIARRREVNDGGARYKGVIGIDIYGLASATDSLMALKRIVFEEKRFSFDEVVAALDTDFAGQEAMRLALLHGAPKYGNDNDEVDAIADDLVTTTADACDRETPFVTDGARFRPIFPGTSYYAEMGKRLQATPDGRHAGEPVSDSGAPANGRDMKGLTALFNSLGRIDHTRFNGMALNVRLNACDFKGEAGRKRFRMILDLMRVKRLQELQFNCVSGDLLREAQREPAKHRNLLIRVAGYSERFTNLQAHLQNAIIGRQEQS
mgnify:CR=1 FL=1